jgi:hypothetical protein
MTEHFGRGGLIREARDIVMSRALRELYGDPPAQLPPSLDSLVGALVEKLTDCEPRSPAPRRRRKTSDR